VWGPQANDFFAAAEGGGFDAGNGTAIVSVSDAVLFCRAIRRSDIASQSHPVYSCARGGRALSMEVRKRYIGVLCAVLPWFGVGCSLYDEQRLSDTAIRTAGATSISDAAVGGRRDASSEERDAAAARDAGDAESFVDAGSPPSTPGKAGAASPPPPRTAGSSAAGSSAAGSSAAGSSAAGAGAAGFGGATTPACASGSDDKDHDGVSDCADQCPDDGNKRELGICGCGVSDQDSDAAASCTGLKNAILHRYTFGGTGRVARDAYGKADAVLLDVDLSGDGNVHLNAKAEGQYVDLPAGIISRLKDATFEAWLTWEGTAKWERVFDFGEIDASASPLPFPPLRSPGSYLFLTLAGSANNARPRAVYLSATSGSNEVAIDAKQSVKQGERTHFAVVIDTTAHQMRLFVNGVLAGETQLNAPLSEIHDMQNWLGRSQYSNDPSLHGVFYEFRIYAAALSAAQIGASFAAGSDPSFLAE
jgi:hypothetical protein